MAHTLTRATRDEHGHVTTLHYEACEDCGTPCTAAAPCAHCLPGVIAYHANAVMRAVREDNLAGKVPADVANFAALHDHVDANEYLADVPAGGDYTLANAVTAEVDRRLAARAQVLRGRAQNARALTGQHVRVRMPSVSGGLTVRWGIIREVTSTHLVMDRYQDCSGHGAYIAGRHVHDGVPVSLLEVRSIDPDPYATEPACPARLAWS